MTLSKKYIALVLALVAALATGFIMGRETHRGGLDARIAAYIAAEAIENALIARNQTKPSTYSQRHKTTSQPTGDITITNSAIIIAGSASVFLLTSWKWWKMTAISA